MCIKTDNISGTVTIEIFEEGGSLWFYTVDKDRFYFDCEYLKFLDFSCENYFHYQICFEKFNLVFTQEEYSGIFFTSYHSYKTGHSYLFQYETVFELLSDIERFIVLNGNIPKQFKKDFEFDFKKTKTFKFLQDKT